MVNPESDNYVSTDWSHPLEELKHSIKVYIGAAGGMTTELSAIGLKLIDVLETIRDHKSPAPELNAMAAAIIRSLTETAIQRLQQLGTEDGNMAANSVAIMRDAVPTNNLHHKQHYLSVLADAYRKLHRITGYEYPVIRNIDGVEL